MYVIILSRQSFEIRTVLGRLETLSLRNHLNPLVAKMRLRFASRRTCWKHHLAKR